MSYPKYNRIAMDQEPDWDEAWSWIDQQYKSNQIPPGPPTHPENVKALAVPFKDIPAETIKDYLDELWDCPDGLSKEELLALMIVMDDIKLYAYNLNK